MQRARDSSKTRNALKGVAIALTVFTFFCIMSRIDYLVHSRLYKFGLQFSYEWAIEYWILYTFMYVIFSLAIGLMFWLGSDRTLRDCKISIAIVATVVLLTIGGLQDLLFFVLWAGGLPLPNVVWWWNPWQHILGTWNSISQIISASLSLFGATLLWIQTIWE